MAGRLAPNYLRMNGRSRTKEENEGSKFSDRHLFCVLWPVSLWNYFARLSITKAECLPLLDNSDPLGEQPFQSGRTWVKGTLPLVAADSCDCRRRTGRCDLTDQYMRALLAALAKPRARKRSFVVHHGSTDGSLEARGNLRGWSSGGSAAESGDGGTPALSTSDRMNSNELKNDLERCERRQELAERLLAPKQAPPSLAQRQMRDKPSSLLSTFKEADLMRTIGAFFTCDQYQNPGLVATRFESLPMSGARG